MGTAIQSYENGGAYLTQWREPEEVLAEATKAAVALKRVVSMKKNPVMFQGEQYLEREDWGTVAKFYGCTAKTLETRYVEFGHARGWEAVAIVIDRNMNEVGRAESMCLSDETNWGEVPVYEWQDELDENGKKIWIEGKDGKKRPKGKKVQTGTSPKPMFQLRSMAATRAEAKALKGVFSWVVVLAGYRPTPAEEMTGNEFGPENEAPPKKEPIKDPQSASQKKQAEQQAQQQQGTGQQTEPTLIEHSGLIETAKGGKDNSLWLSLKSGLIVFVIEANIDGDMKPGMFLKFRGYENKRETTTFWTLKALIELSPVQDGQPTEEKKLAPDAAKVAEEMFPDKGKAVIEGMVENGTLKPASEVETGKTIGKKRAQRLYTMCSQNKAKNNGLNEEIIKTRILSTLPIPLEHLSDLELGMYADFEKFATGEVDWQEWLNSD